MTGAEETLLQTSAMSKTERKDMTETMEETMQRLQGRFQSISEQLESKHFSFIFTLNEMGTRINDLEKNVSDLMTQAGMEEQAVPK